MDSSTGTTLLNKDKINKEVIFPYLTGQDLYQDINQRPTRYIINFFDWELDVVKKYDACFNIVTERVEPQRDEIISKGKQIHEYDYWKYWDRRDYLYVIVTI